jgi:hypothetical protein
MISFISKSGMSSVAFVFVHPRTGKSTSIREPFTSDSPQPFAFYERLLCDWFDAQGIAARARLRFTNATGQLLTADTAIESDVSVTIAAITAIFHAPLDSPTTYEQLCEFPLTEAGCMRAARRMLDVHFHFPSVVFPRPILTVADDADGHRLALERLPPHFSLRLGASGRFDCQLLLRGKPLTPFVVLGSMPLAMEKDFQLELADLARRALQVPVSSLAEIEVRQIAEHRYEIVESLRQAIYSCHVDGIDDPPFFLVERPKPKQLMERFRRDFVWWASDPSATPSIEIIGEAVMVAHARVVKFRLPTGRRFRVFCNEDDLNIPALTELGRQCLVKRCGWATIDATQPVHLQQDEDEFVIVINPANMVAQSCDGGLEEVHAVDLPRGDHMICFRREDGSVFTWKWPFETKSATALEEVRCLTLQPVALTWHDRSLPEFISQVWRSSPSDPVDVVAAQPVHIVVVFESDQPYEFDMTSVDSVEFLKIQLMERLRAAHPDRRIQADTIELLKKGEVIDDQNRLNESCRLTASCSDAISLNFRCNDKVFSHTFDVQTKVVAIRAYLAQYLGAELHDIRVVFLGRELKDRFAIGGLNVRPGREIIVYNDKIESSGLLIMSGTIKPPLAINFWYRGKKSIVSFDVRSTVGDAKAHCAQKVLRALQGTEFDLWFKGKKLTDNLLFCDLRVRANRPMHVIVVVRGEEADGPVYMRAIREIRDAWGCPANMDELVDVYNQSGGDLDEVDQFCELSSSA